MAPTSVTRNGDCAARALESLHNLEFLLRTGPRKYNLVELDNDMRIGLSNI